MRVTNRDIRLVRDVALSHVLTGDQMMRLGYFGSATRCNTRLRELLAARFLRVIETPYFGSRLLSVGPKASDVVGEKIAHLISARASSPRFLQHALTVTEVRIALVAGNSTWRFEQQLRQAFMSLGRRMEIRPDGMVVTGESSTYIEVDMGSSSDSKLIEKLKGYCAWNELQGRVHPVAFFAPSNRRAKHIEKLCERVALDSCTAACLDSLKVEIAGGWS